ALVCVSSRARPSPAPPPFPYTTLFRSAFACRCGLRHHRRQFGDNNSGLLGGAPALDLIAADVRRRGVLDSMGAAVLDGDDVVDGRVLRLAADEVPRRWAAT